MTSPNHRWLGLGLAIFFSLNVFSPIQAAEKETVRIGLVQTMFTDVPEFMVRMAVQPLTALIKEHTGLKAQLLVGGDAFELGRKLHNDEVDLAVFHGIEMAWAQQKYANLKPLIISHNKFPSLRANLVVRQDSPLGNLVDLKGKTLAVPKQTKVHCRIFLDHQCSCNCQCNARAFFKALVNPCDYEEAIDDVLAGKVQAALVDDWAMYNYSQNKPDRFPLLKILKKSEQFPTGTIAYREGALDSVTLQRFRQGMSNASNTVRGREMMNWFRIRAFQVVPQEYLQQLADAIKAYPPPETPISTTVPN